MDSLCDFTVPLLSTLVRQLFAASLTFTGAVDDTLVGLSDARREISLFIRSNHTGAPSETAKIVSSHPMTG